MSRPLTAAEKQSIDQAIAFLLKLMDCYESVVGPNASTTEDIKRTRDTANDLKSMLDSGKIDVESDSVNIKAETTGSGIHINDTSTFSMPGDLHLEDCAEGYFASLWTLIEMLIHEHYHYEHHTGFFGRVLRRVPDTFFGGAVLVFDSLFGETVRTWKWHEFKAYAHTHNLLIFIEGAVHLVCRMKPDCLGCCAKHQQEVDQAKQRENPWSTYGG